MPGAPGTLHGEVYVVEPMGNETLVDVRLGGERLVGAGRSRLSAPPSASNIGVTFDTADACFFNRVRLNRGASCIKQGRKDMSSMTASGG